MKGEVDLLLHVIHGEKPGHESSLFFGILQERIHAAPYQVVLLNALLFSVWHIGYILGGVDGALRGLSSVRTVRWEFSRMRWKS